MSAVRAGRLRRRGRWRGGTRRVPHPGARARFSRRPERNATSLLSGASFDARAIAGAAASNSPSRRCASPGSPKRRVRPARRARRREFLNRRVDQSDLQMCEPAIEMPRRLLVRVRSGRRRARLPMQIEIGRGAGKQPDRDDRGDPERPSTRCGHQCRSRKAYPDRAPEDNDEIGDAFPALPPRMQPARGRDSARRRAGKRDAPDSIRRRRLPAPPIADQLMRISTDLAAVVTANDDISDLTAILATIRARGSAHAARRWRIARKAARRCSAKRERNFGRRSRSSRALLLARVFPRADVFRSRPNARRLATSLTPGLKRARTAAILLLLGETERQLANPKRAVEVLRQVIQLEP